MGLRMPEEKWMIFAVTGVANMVTAFTVSAISLALPVMAEEFGVSMAAVSWLSLIYSIIPSCTLLIFGRLADLYGYKRQFICGFIVFGLSSLLAPMLAGGLGQLIFFRCWQGIGYGLMISITQAMCNRTFPPQERGRALGVNSVFVSIGSACGPTIGGFLLTYYSWRAIFYFNVPFCVLGVVAASLVIKKEKLEDSASRVMDWPGAFCFAAFIGLLAVAINFSAEWGLGDPRFYGCLAFSALALALFISRENRAPLPMMALSLFKNRVFSAANAACMLSYMIQQMTTFLIPFFLMNVLLLSKNNSGLVMLATPLGLMLFAPGGGYAADRYGSRRPAVVGLAIIGAGCLLVSRLTQATPLPLIVFALFCYGMGTAISVASINTAIFSAVTRERSGIASGMVATMRNLGQGLGVAFAGAIVALRQARYQAAGLGTGASGAYLLAQRDAFYFGLLIVGLAIVCMATLPNRIEQAK